MTARSKRSYCRKAKRSAGVRRQPSFTCSPPHALWSLSCRDPHRSSPLRSPSPAVLISWWVADLRWSVQASVTPHRLWRMGTAHVAEHIGPSKQVAVKVPNPQ